MVNGYSQTWFKLFLETQPYTEQEVNFLLRNLPNPPYRRILDVCCGPGRHSQPLVEHGYQLVGIDLDENALAKARRLSNGLATYLQLDMRQLVQLDGDFDAMICLWQSFGYFDEATNQDVLRQISQKLRQGGRFILDIYHRDYFAQNQGIRHYTRMGVSIAASNRMAGNRLIVHLEYSDGSPGDNFEWQLFTPEEICQAAAEVGLHTCLVCTEYNEQEPASPAKPRMQLVFERRPTENKWKT